MSRSPQGEVVAVCTVGGVTSVHQDLDEEELFRIARRRVFRQLTSDERVRFGLPQADVAGDAMGRAGGNAGHCAARPPEPRLKQPSANESANDRATLA